MQIQEVMMAAVVGIVVGLLIVPAVKGVRLLVLKLVASRKMNRANGRGEIAKRTPKARQPVKKAVVGVDRVDGVPTKRRGRPVNSVEKAAGSVVSKDVKTIESTKPRRGRPSNVEIARRTAEAAKLAENRNNVVDELNPGDVVLVKAAINAQLLELSPDQFIEGTKPRRGRPSKVEIARRTAEAARLAENRNNVVDEFNPGAVDYEKAGINAQLLELSPDQLSELAVLRYSQQAALDGGQEQ